MLVFRKKQFQLRKREEKENLEEYFISSFTELIKQGQFKKLKRITNILFQMSPPLAPVAKKNTLYTYLSMSDFSYFNNVQLERILISMKEEKEEREEVYLSYLIILLIKSIYTPEILKLFSNLKNICIKNIFLFDWIQLMKEKKIRFHGVNLLERTLNDTLERERIKLKLNKKEIQMEFNYLKEHLGDQPWNEEYLKFISTHKETIVVDTVFLQRILSMFESHGLSLELKEEILMHLMSILIQNVKELNFHQKELCYSVLKRIFLKWYFHRVTGKSFEFLGHLSDSLSTKYTKEILNLFSNFLKKKTPLFLWNNYLKGLLLFCKVSPLLDYSLLLSSNQYSKKNEQLLHSSLIYKFFSQLNNEKEMKPLLLLERKEKNYLILFIISSFINQGSLNYYNFIANHYFHPNSVEMIGICNCIPRIPYQFDLFKQWIGVILKILLYEMFEYTALEEESLTSSKVKELILKKNDLFFQYQGIFPSALSILSNKDVELVDLILNESFPFLKKVNELWNSTWKKNNEKIFSFLRNIFSTFYEIFSQLNVSSEEQKMKVIHSLSYLEFIKDKSMMPLLKKLTTQESSLLPNKVLSSQLLDTTTSTSRLYFYLNYFHESMELYNHECITFLFKYLPIL
jgi:hypothetical protein